MKPTIGRVVIYNTTENERRQMRTMQNCNVAEKLPAIIAAVWGDQEDSCVNLHVLLDGVGNLWATSVIKGDAEGNWSWPVIEK